MTFRNRKVSLPRLTAAMLAVGVVAAVGATAGVSSVSRASDENYNAKPALLLKAFGTTKAIPQALLASVYRAGLPVTGLRARIVSAAARRC